MSDVRLLHKAMDDTRVALAELIDPQRRAYMRELIDPDTGNVIGVSGTTRHDAPSLLAQLLGAVGNGGGRPGGPRRSAPIPISADAVDVLDSITRGTGTLVILAGVSTSLPVEAALRAVVAAAAAWTDLEAVHGVRLALQGWVKAIRTLLDPPKRLYLAAPCPRCDQSMVWRWDDSIGEDVQQPALQVDGSDGCSCLSCGAHWAPELFEHLAAVLGCTPLPGAEGNGETAA